MATKKKATKSTPQSVEHPEVSCPFPEHWRVDLESAQTEAMKARTPANAGLPVFSTRALEHGMKAFGAAGLRKGFAWNSQMDLAWALGYPDMLFIVDGMLESDSRDDLLAYYERTMADLKLQDRFSHMTGGEYERLIPRRAAFARLYEVENRQHPFDLSDAEFLKVTEPRSLSSDEMKRLLRKTPFVHLEEVGLILEALEGTSAVAPLLVEMMENLESLSEDEDEQSSISSRVQLLLCPFSRRLPKDERAELFARAGKVTPWARDPHTLGLEALENDDWDDVVDALQWIDGFEEEIQRGFLEEFDIPSARCLFAGGEALFQPTVDRFKNDEDGPLNFYREYSTIQHPLMTMPALDTRKLKHRREGMTLWFQKHAEFFKPVLSELEADSAQGKNASALLKILK